MSEPVYLELGIDGPPPEPAPAEPAACVARPHGPIEFDGPATYPDDVADRLRQAAAPIVARYPQSRSALLPLLHLMQSQDGHLTRAGIALCAEILDLTDAQVAAVSTFYSMFRRTPTGEYLIGVCTNTLCGVLGGDEILRTVCEHLGVAPGETTEDHRITVEHLECNAACDLAPVVMVNWEFYDNQTPSSARDLVDGLREGTPPAPTRGAPLCSFRDTARTLAGLTNPHTSGGSPGAATLAGLREARKRGMSAPEAGPIA